MDKQTFGKRLKQARLEQNFTSDMLAEACGINPVFVRQIESGARLPSIGNFIILCNALQVSPAFLLGEDLNLKDESLLLNLMQKLQTLSPKQLNMVCTSILILIDQWN